MTQLKLLRYAQETAVRKFRFCNDLASNFKGDAISDMASKMATYIMTDIREIEQMINTEETRLHAEAEKQQAQQTAVAQQAQQERQAAGELHRPEVHRYETVIEYSYGHVTRTDYPNKEVAVRAYNILKDLMGTIPVIERISLTENAATIRSCERDEF